MKSKGKRTDQEICDRINETTEILKNSETCKVGYAFFAHHPSEKQIKKWQIEESKEIK